MALVRFDPMRLMRWPDIWEDEDWDMQTATGGNMDVYETENEVIVSANVPGVKEDSVEVTFEKGVLWIQAEESSEEADEDRKYYRRSQRSFSYKVAVPGNIDLKQDPEAEIEKGVVSVRFKKAEEAKPKQIKVRSKS